MRSRTLPWSRRRRGAARSRPTPSSTAATAARSAARSSAGSSTGAASSPWCERGAHLLVGDGGIERAQRARQHPVDLQHDHHGCGEPAARLQPADGALAHPSETSHLILRQTEKLTDATQLAPEVAHPFPPIYRFVHRDIPRSAGASDRLKSALRDTVGLPRHTPDYVVPSSR